MPGPARTDRRSALLAVAALAGSQCSLATTIGAEDAVSRILDIDTYARLRHGVPYVLSFDATKRAALLLYGARHSSDDAAAQVADIATQWSDFRADVAFNEGGDPPTLDDPVTAVRRHGEAGLLRHLAARDRVPIATFEPRPEVEVAALLTLASREQVKAFISLRFYLSLRRSRRDEDPAKFMQRTLSSPYAGLGGHGEAPDSLAALAALCRREYGLADWRAVEEHWFHPTLDEHFSNRLARASSVVRDRHIFGVLVDRVRRGDRVFAVIGAGHVPMLEPALVAALGPVTTKREGEVRS